MNLPEFFDRAGWITLALAVGLQMGLLIRAETTPVQLLSDVRTAPPPRLRSSWYSIIPTHPVMEPAERAPSAGRCRRRQTGVH